MPRYFRGDADEGARVRRGRALLRNLEVPPIGGRLLIATSFSAPCPPSVPPAGAPDLLHDGSVCLGQCVASARLTGFVTAAPPTVTMTRDGAGSLFVGIWNPGQHRHCGAGQRERTRSGG